MTIADKPEPGSMTSRDLAEILHFYAEAGVDCALNDIASNRFTEPNAAMASQQNREQLENAGQPAGLRKPRQPPETSSSVTPKSSAELPSGARPPTVPDEASVAGARQAASEANTIDELREILAGFNECNLRFGAKNTVFADGNPAADVMFIGEAPGRDEDRQGLPFVGRAGQLLDKMLNAIGLDRTTSYITNIIPWRPPGNRTPTPLEIELCRPFVERHVALAAPKVVVLLGNVPTKTLLQTSRGILSIRGTWSTYHPNSDTNIPALPSLHPAYLLRNPLQKRLSWQDFLSVRLHLDALDGESTEG